MMFLLMVRVEDPLVPRAMFGILNTLLFFPSGASIRSMRFPQWLQAIARVDPFTYAVHGLKGVLLKEAGFAAIFPDALFLTVFGLTCLFAGNRAVQADAVRSTLAARTGGAGFIVV